MANIKRIGFGLQLFFITLLSGRSLGQWVSWLSRIWGSSESSLRGHIHTQTDTHKHAHIGELIGSIRRGKVKGPRGEDWVEWKLAVNLGKLKPETASCVVHHEWQLHEVQIVRGPIHQTQMKVRASVAHVRCPKYVWPKKACNRVCVCGFNPVPCYSFHVFRLLFANENEKRTNNFKQKFHIMVQAGQGRETSEWTYLEKDE